MRRHAATVTLLTAVLGLLPVHLTHAAAPPTISDLDPAAGHRESVLRVLGTDVGGATSVTLGGVPAAFSVVSAAELRVVVPATAGDGPVTVTTPDGSATSAESFDVLAPQVTSLSLTATPAALTYGTRSLLVARLSGPGGVAVAGQPVRFYARPKGGSTYRLLGTVATDPQGVSRLTYPPRAHTEYVAQHPAGPAATFSTSGVVTALVRPGISARALPLAVQQRQLATFDGFVSPPHPGHAVIVQQHLGGTSWRDIGWALVGADGRFAWRQSFLTAGTFTFRVRKPADADHLEAASAPFRLTVVLRTLSKGMRGSDVLALEQRLAALRFDVAAVDGYYDYDTEHAVQAFEKFYGLYRDGVTTAADRARIIGAALPRPTYPRTGLAVEVDLTRQVVVLARDGAVVRVVDASSGNGKVYYDRGQENYAVTPEGFFEVERKIPGLRESSLGTLWKPAYWYAGFAIHGSGSVPAYPASHGCVRVTNPAMDRLYPILPVGTPVTVYRS